MRHDSVRSVPLPKVVNMYKFAFVVFLICTAYGDEQVPIVSQENVVEPDGSFHYGFESGDGTKVSQQGALKPVGSEQAEAISGSYAYTDPDGQKIEVAYVADENGYQPTGEHIPKVPEYVARAIKWIEAHPQPESTRGKNLV